MIKGGKLLFVWPRARSISRTRHRRRARRIQKYFVDKSPKELRNHFTSGGERGRAARTMLVT